VGLAGGRRELEVSMYETRRGTQIFSRLCEPGEANVISKEKQTMGGPPLRREISERSAQTCSWRVQKRGTGLEIAEIINLEGKKCSEKRTATMHPKKRSCSRLKGERKRGRGDNRRTSRS